MTVGSTGFGRKLDHIDRCHGSSAKMSFKEWDHNIIRAEEGGVLGCGQIFTASEAIISSIGVNPISIASDSAHLLRGNIIRSFSLLNFYPTTLRTLGGIGIAA